MQHYIPTGYPTAPKPLQRPVLVCDAAEQRLVDKPFIFSVACMCLRMLFIRADVSLRVYGATCSPRLLRGRAAATQVQIDPGSNGLEREQQQPL